jgi:hypothetical protein
MPQAAARRVKKDSRDMPQVFGFAHVFIAKPLHTFARHALNLGRTNPGTRPLTEHRRPGGCEHENVRACP